VLRETNLDDVMQINNVFVNVSKGEVAKSEDLQKAFGSSNVTEIVKEVGGVLFEWVGLLRSMRVDSEKGRSASRGEGEGPGSDHAAEGDCDAGV
jgi:hypothetical protein